VAERTVITVDGLAGAGKTALAQALAQRLGFAHLKSGLLYRAVGFLALREAVNLHNEETLAGLIAGHNLELVLGEDASSRVLIDGEEVGARLHQPDVSEAASIAAVQPQVRAALVEAQRQAFAGHGLVAEGRDMGTIIFPDAALTFFVCADVDVRVARRLTQLYGSTHVISAERLNLLKREIEIEVIDRDRRDTERSLSPTKPADGAIMVDNSAQTLTQVVQSMYDSVASKGLVHR
jgi:CMP/dCMP kinase